MDRRWHFLLFLFCFAVPTVLCIFTLQKVTSPLLQHHHAAPRPSAHPAAAAQGAPFAPSSSANFSASDENHLRDLFRQGEACPLLSSSLTARAPLPALLRLFPDHVAAPLASLEAYLAASSARSTRDFEAALRSASSPLLDFTEAAAKLGLLRTPAHPDPRAAAAILRALSDSDSDNALPSLLLAYALARSGNPEEGARELERAFARPAFRFYADEALAPLFRAAEGVPALESAALAIRARAPTPDLFPVEDFVLEMLLSADLRFALPAYRFGRRLGQTGGYNFGFGQRIALAAWRRAHPAQRAPEALAARPSQSFHGLSLPLARGACEKQWPGLAAAFAPTTTL